MASTPPSISLLSHLQIYKHGLPPGLFVYRRLCHGHSSRSADRIISYESALTTQCGASPATQSPSSYTILCLSAALPGWPSSARGRMGAYVDLHPRNAPLVVRTDRSDQKTDQDSLSRRSFIQQYLDYVPDWPGRDTERVRQIFDL